MNSFSIQNFGCRVNQAEAFLWADEFQKNGLRYERDFLKSDLVIINSCTLTQRADSDVRQFIKKISTQNPRAKLILTGCYAERLALEGKEAEGIWKTFLNSEKNYLVGDLLSLLELKNEFKTRNRARRRFRSRALVKAQDGCDFGCTFCIIPRVRGRSRSVPQGEVLKKIREFASQGFREIVLTGINLCSYGLDLSPPSSLLDLLKEIENIEGLGRIRLSSLDPRFLDFSLLEHFVKSSKICPHFHLSLQHGSEKVLAKMGRKIEIEDYTKILLYLRGGLPQASLGADIIVGFPGESEEDFQKTYTFLQDSPLTYFHVFSYSPRPGTMASHLPQIDSKLKKKRSEELRRLSRFKSLQFYAQAIGGEYQAVVIRKEKKEAKVLTSNYLKVFVPFCFKQEGEEVRVKVTGVEGMRGEGEIVEQ